MVTAHGMEENTCAKSLLFYHYLKWELYTSSIPDTQSHSIQLNFDQLHYKTWWEEGAYASFLLFYHYFTWKLHSSLLQITKTI